MAAIHASAERCEDAVKRYGREPTGSPLTRRRSYLRYGRNVQWEAFAQACPEIAGLARDGFAKDELVMLGTIRSDGSPRVSPCEEDFPAGRLIAAMLWPS